MHGPLAMHTPLLLVTHAPHHACLPAMHAPWPCMPTGHAYPSATHAPPPCMPPAMYVPPASMPPYHACPPPLHPLWTEWQTGVKTLPCHNFVAVGNKPKCTKWLISASFWLNKIQYCNNKYFSVKDIQYTSLLPMLVKCRRHRSTYVEETVNFSLNTDSFAPTDVSPRELHISERKL